MKKTLPIIFLILGTVIGSGFSTGKEIAVFFSRFGAYSFFFIPIVFLLFYFAFYFLMTKGKSFVEHKKSKLVYVLMIFCACIFSSSMLAGIENCGLEMGKSIYFVLFVLVILLCYIACYKKLIFLSKMNLFLIPFLLTVMVAFFFNIVPTMSFDFPKIDLFYGFFGGGTFCLLYVMLNLSLSSVVIASSGEGMTKKQIRFVSFMSAFILSTFIFVIDLVILCNYDLINSDMPLLKLSGGVMNVFLHFVIVVGCLTTLLSMVYISSSSCLKLGLSKLMIFIISVMLPIGVSLFGFSKVVSYLYPFASFLGIILLFLIFGKKKIII